MRWLTVLALPAILCCSVSASAQVNPVNDFFGGVSAFTIGGHASDPVRRTPVGWQISASQKIKSAEEAATRGDSPLSLVGDVGGQFSTLDKGRALHAYEYMGGVRVRAGAIKKPTSVFGHALFGGATRSIDGISETGFMMGYGGGIDVVPPGGAYALGVRTQFDWLPSRLNGAWNTSQFRLAFGIVIMARYWD